jgi:hypothetical protein
MTPQDSLLRLETSQHESSQSALVQLGGTRTSSGAAMLDNTQRRLAYERYVQHTVDALRLQRRQIQRSVGAAQRPQPQAAMAASGMVSAAAFDDA